MNQETRIIPKGKTAVVDNHMGIETDKEAFDTKGRNNKERKHGSQITQKN